MLFLFKFQRIVFLTKNYLNLYKFEYPKKFFLLRDSLNNSKGFFFLDQEIIPQWLSGTFNYYVMECKMFCCKMQFFWKIATETTRGRRGQSSLIFWPQQKNFLFLMQSEILPSYRLYKVNWLWQQETIELSYTLGGCQFQYFDE